MHQDGYYFDRLSHSFGELTTRLATAPHNVQAAIDQRLNEALQGVTSLVVGIAFAMWWGPNLVPIVLTTSLIFVGAQLTLSRYVKHRGMQDLRIADETSRVEEMPLDLSEVNGDVFRLRVNQSKKFKQFKLWGDRNAFMQISATLLKSRTTAQS